MKFQLSTPVLLLLFYCVQLSAGQATVQFSAETITSVPQQGEQQGKIYVGDDRMRTETNINGSTMIQIIDIRNQTAYMLNSGEKTYMRRQAAGAAASGAGEVKTGDPCAGMLNISCKKLGTETINNRPADKWEMTSQQGEDSSKMLTWIDQQRHIPVRQTMPDGSQMEMSMVGTETVKGRKTEKWVMKASRPGGQSQTSYQWYDPEIQMNIREEQPGGIVRELVNIRIGKQPASLFKVPSGYSEISIPGADAGQGQMY